jgi:hypothetical protein
MRVLTGTAAVAALVLGSASTHAQTVYVEPGYVAEPAPAYVAPAPGAVVVPAYTRPVFVNPYTGRTCTIEPSGYRWCWTP